MSDVVVKPCRTPGDPVLEGPGIFAVNPVEAADAMELAKSLGGKRHFLFNSRLAIVSLETGGPSIFLAGPAVGAPMAVMTLEKLIALGATQIVVVGWCGSLTEELVIGDLLLPTWAHIEEGTSAHYPIQGRAESDNELRSQVKDYLQGMKYRIHEGPIWTTDAPYRETREKVESYAAQGISGVDMEFSALSTVALFRHVKLAAVYLVSDELWHEKWKPGFKKKAFQIKSNAVLCEIMSFMRKFQK